MLIRSMMLIHGAWQGSWAFEAWLPHLAARGWGALAVDLPGNGSDDTPQSDVCLARYVDHVADRLQSFEGPVVVLGHSGGGVVASQLAERLPERVACLVYLAGMMLPSGGRYAEVVREALPALPQATGIAPYLLWSEDGRSSQVSAEGARRLFLHDCPAAAAEAAIARLRPQAEAGRDLSPTLSAERYGGVPRVYVEALQDRSVLLPLQRRMQALSPGAQRLSIDCGHVPQLVRPAALTALLCDALEARLDAVAA